MNKDDFHFKIYIFSTGAFREALKKKFGHLSNRPGGDQRGFLHQPQKKAFKLKY